MSQDVWLLVGREMNLLAPTNKQLHHNYALCNNLICDSSAYFAENYLENIIVYLQVRRKHGKNNYGF